MASGPSFRFERSHPAPVCGVDEAGRGPLAGPVVAAAVILPGPRRLKGIDDSKKLTPDRRAELSGRLLEIARVGIGVADVEEIDRLNIYWATMLAMTRAVDALCADGGCAPAMVLVDGNALPRWDYPSRALVGGDALCLSIAAASIIAKHHRDALMIDYDLRHPGYGWRQNKGYATREHREALARLGATPLHRRSFAPVAQCELL